MIEPIPAYAQQAYAILYNRFEGQPFEFSYLAWFLSESMVKKIIHVLEKKGWIRRVSKGSYFCLKPSDVFGGMIESRIPRLLYESGRKYSYTGASAVEVWTNYSYLQRGWEHSPYFVRVLREDVEFWRRYFREHRVNMFVGGARLAIGEFVVLFPERRLDFELHDGEPVDKLREVVRFCERNIEAFEYPLAYLKEKFGIATRASIDERVLKEAARVVI